MAAQNVGDNSLMQNAVSIGEVQAGKGAKLKVAAATSRNDATDRRNVAYSFDTPTATSIRNSADGSEGIIGLNQNAAPNSIVQNSVGLTAVVMKPMGSAGLGGVVAGSINCGVDAGNVGSTTREYNSTTMSHSLNGSAGVLEAAQNAGSNSVLQNAATLSVVAPAN